MYHGGRVLGGHGGIVEDATTSGAPRGHSEATRSGHGGHSWAQGGTHRRCPGRQARCCGCWPRCPRCSCTTLRGCGWPASAAAQPRRPPAPWGALRDLPGGPGAARRSSEALSPPSQSRSGPPLPPQPPPPPLAARRAWRQALGASSHEGPCSSHPLVPALPEAPRPLLPPSPEHAQCESLSGLAAENICGPERGGWGCGHRDCLEQPLWASETSYGLVGCWAGQAKEVGMASGVLCWLVGLAGGGGCWLVECFDGLWGSTMATGALC